MALQTMERVLKMRPGHEEALAEINDVRVLAQKQKLQGPGTRAQVEEPCCRVGASSGSRGTPQLPSGRSGPQ